VFGHQQFVQGYLLLLPDPVVPDLNSLTPERRSQFLLDMSHLGDALIRTTAPLRINYAIYGNLEPALHAHVIPRYRHEPAPLGLRLERGARFRRWRFERARQGVARRARDARYAAYAVSHGCPAPVPCVPARTARRPR
jgi:diadenosine tetraphosphate (Ap4A) HIT family hydrolase